MAKNKSPVDAALEVARKVRVPKKPLKAKGKKTVPTKLDWGPGIPEDKLAYLNDEEMALVQAKRGYKGKRSFDGIPAFPDPGDTGAGDNSRLPDGGGGVGTGGRPGGAGGQSGSGAPGAGGASKGSTSGAGGPSAGADSKQSAPASAPMGGPTGGPTSAPARTEPSRGATPPSSFGPRAGSMPGTPVSTAPSTAAYEGALSRIAQGSSVIGGPAGPKIQDRAPQAPPSTVSYSQTPTIGPSRGLGAVPAAPGSFSQPDYSIGGNSPLSSLETTSYDRMAQDKLNAEAAAKNMSSGLLGSSVPVGTAGYTAEQQAARYPGAPTYNATDTITNALEAAKITAPVGKPAIGVNPNLYSSPIAMSRPPTEIAQDPSLAGRALSANTLGERLVNASVGAANTIGDYASSLFGGTPTVAGVDPRVSQTPFGAYPKEGYVRSKEQILSQMYQEMPTIEKGVYNTAKAIEGAGNYLGSAARNVGDYASSLFGGTPTTQAATTTGINPQTGLPFGEKIQDRLPTSTVPTIAGVNPQTGLPFGEKLQGRLPSYEAPTPISPAQEAMSLQQTIDDYRKVQADREFSRSIGENIYGGTPETLTSTAAPASAPASVGAAPNVQSTPAPSVAATNPAVMNTPYGPVTQAQFDRMTPVDQQKLRDWAQNYAATATSVFNKSPAEQARDVRQAINLATAATAPRGPTNVNVPGADLPVGPMTVSPSQEGYSSVYDTADVSPSQGDYSPSQAPSYDTSPSQQSGLTAAQRESYLGSLGGDRTGGGVRRNVGMGYSGFGAGAKKAPVQYLKPLPPWENYSYLYSDYPEIGNPSPNIAAFNEYNATMKRGGRVGDSVDAAMRLARQTVVRRPKTR